MKADHIGRVWPIEYGIYCMRLKLWNKALMESFLLPPPADFEDQMVQMVSLLYSVVNNHRHRADWGSVSPREERLRVDLRGLQDGSSWSSLKEAGTVAASAPQEPG
ncbi:hypothetical protein NDU88_003282 [Pleurodeles waltl]|uniref:Uncharacterized protein n=1 Tax=Pleurodeles waltl TaxID=8319 RepID=A0AAV7UY10_PLEWA|nr:hypothetical protein NDU88_003282 [Pleurodeles waltl]